MPLQKVPDISFSEFTFGEILGLFERNKIKINTEYQRGDIWTPKQRESLIKSIERRYSIGVLVLFKNDDGQYEVLDGQQRLLTIKKYIKGRLDLSKTEIKEYQKLTQKEKNLIDGYCIYYLRLKSFDEETREEDISQTFLRLQEGSPLNKAEKINACRGAFKDTLVKLKVENPFFKFLEPDKRFRLRLLSAEFLLLELETNFQKFIFPSLTLDSFMKAIKNYEKGISKNKIKFISGNLNFLTESLNNLLTARSLRDIISFYLLISYLRKKKANNLHLVDEFRIFAEEFLKILNSFSIYDSSPPKGLRVALFKKYKSYKEEARKATSPESLESRFKFILEEFERMYPFKEKDPKRFHNTKQKRILFFRQKGLCSECKKPLDFRCVSSDHMKPHSKGGKTSSLKEAQLLHHKCHEKLEKKRRKK